MDIEYIKDAEYMRNKSKVHAANLLSAIGITHLMEHAAKDNVGTIRVQERDYEENYDKILVALRFLDYEVATKTDVSFGAARKYAEVYW